LFPTIKQFKDSRWFERGWTLQELIAPSKVVFLSKEWTRFGTKKTLEKDIQQVTGIDISVLRVADIHSLTVAQRMSWISTRQTTRVEDIAYRLLGIFDVNMPLLYGEGEKSFMRLQEEIVKKTNDQSLFAWRNNSALANSTAGLFADSPSYFKESGDFSSLGLVNISSPPISVTNAGLSVSLYLIPYDEKNGIYIASLWCTTQLPSNKSPAIYLQRIYGDELQTLFPNVGIEEEYSRIRTNELETLDAQQKVKGFRRIVRVKQTPLVRWNTKHLYFHIGMESIVLPEDQWDGEWKILWLNLTPGKLGGCMLKIVTGEDSPIVLVVLGVTSTREPWCHCIESTAQSYKDDWNSYKPDGTETEKSELRFLKLLETWHNDISAIRVSIQTSSVINHHLYSLKAEIVGVDVGRDWRTGARESLQAPPDDEFRDIWSKPLIKYDGKGGYRSYYRKVVQA
jgi:hypothetical protein